MLAGMIATSLAWIAIIVVFFGVGCLVMAALGRRPDDVESALATFWLGWAPIVAALQVAHVFAPVGGAHLAATAVLGCVGLVLCRASIRAAAANFRHRASASPATTWIAVAIVVLFVLWLANRAMAPITPQGDSGFYHIGMVRWLQAEPLLPGLGNVDGRFGFNNALFLYLAMLDGAAGPPHFYHLGMPVLFLVFTAECALHVAALMGRGVVRASGAFPAPRHLLGSLWVAAVVPFFFVELGSTSTDTSNLILGFVIGLHLFRLVFERLAPGDVAFHALVVFALSVVGVTIKLSFAFLGFFACAVAAARFVESRADAPWPGWRSALFASRVPIVVAVAIVTVVLGTWLARGVVMTGYFAYPSTTALFLDVDWKVPEEQVIGEADAIKVWARYPFVSDRSWDDILSGWDWFGPWLLKTLERADVFTVPMLLFLAGGVVYGRRARREGLDVKRALLFLTPPAIAFVLWFVTAPAERFGGAIFWLLGAGVWAALYAQTTSTALRATLVGSVRVFVPVTVAAAAVAGAVLSHDRYGWAVFVSPGPENGFHPLPEAVLEEYVSRSGVVHAYPVGVRPGSSKWIPGVRCWDAPLPCTKGPLPNLETREPETWDRGFRLAPPQ